MTSIKEHKKKIVEHLEEIEDAINNDIEKKPITIGFHCSACSIQLLEVYLHKINKISIGKVIKHDWFKKPKLEQKKNPLIERKLSIKFPKKEEIYKLIYEIEEDRNSLMYGAPKKEKIKKVLKNFQELKEIFKLLLKNEIEL
ncbi:hypothetical protein J4406_01025 [Candidatus Woesearchaeota archaeon]|nr:hypothetical protein [Candidatus Woesearchaeota archaeon]